MYKNKSDCEASKGEWIEGNCSLPQFTTKETCTGSLKYYTEAETGDKCRSISGTILSSRTDKKTCEIALNWEKSEFCSYSELTSKKECEAKEEFIPETLAKCIPNPDSKSDSKSSSNSNSKSNQKSRSNPNSIFNSQSNFIKSINIALFAAYLLF